MWALPPGFRHIKGNQVTGLSCPDCDGVLQVNVAEPDSGYVTFVCRIGHAYSLAELLAAKETTIEMSLRGCEVAFAELIQLLEDLAEDGGAAANPIDGADGSERLERLARHVTSLRAIIEQNQPLDFARRQARGQADPAEQP